LCRHSTGRIAENAETVGGQRQYFRFSGGLRPFIGEKAIAEVAESLNSTAAREIDNRMKAFATDSSPRFVYAANKPRPMAAILVCPPRPDLGIAGDSWACYPENEGVTRIYFGRLADEAKGVLFLNMYYVLDGFPQVSSDAE
jgi:hypothetical protein